eukprot:s2896_g5.t1
MVGLFVSAAVGTFVSLAAGKSHSCGIRPSGLLECWGSNSHHQAEPPDLELRQVACGAAHTCALASASWLPGSRFGFGRVTGALFS